MFQGAQFCPCSAEANKFGQGKAAELFFFPLLSLLVSEAECRSSSVHLILAQDHVDHSGLLANFPIRFRDFWLVNCDRSATQAVPGACKVLALVVSLVGKRKRALERRELTCKRL